MWVSHGYLGLITLATDSGVAPDYARLLPPEVRLSTASIPLPRGEVTPAALGEMLAGDDLERAARTLAREGAAAPDLILFACTTGSLVHGLGWDRALIARIERATGLPATTTTTAVLAALRAVGATALAIATPYLDALNAIERRFFVANGFAVPAIAGLRCATDAAIGRLTAADAAALVASVDTPAADAIFISCTNFRCLDVIDALEQRHGKPVITSNQAGAWFAWRRLIPAAPGPVSVPGYGALFTHLHSTTPSLLMEPISP